MFRDKGLIFGIIATIILIGGGVFLMSRESPGSSSKTIAPISSDILNPKGGNQTGGIENGNYLPATSSAKITLVEFGDYECPACSVYNQFVKQILSDFRGNINYVFRSFPLPQHKNAWISSQAAEAAGLQGKYWQMHDKLYETQADWSSNTDAKTIFISYAQNLGLDLNKFKADIDSQTVKDKIQADYNDGNFVKLDSTPTFYLNGTKVELSTGKYDDLRNAVNAELSK